MKNLILFCFLLIVVSCNNSSDNIQKENKTTETKLIWHWEDDFSPSEQAKIKKYISAVTHSAFILLGKYPFDVHYYFVRSDSETEPIPWAYTVRKNKIQGVRFHINPEFNYEVLYADWTAPHEISHLSIPHLGKENSWFAEGYASYMQYQIMQELGVYTKEEVAKKYKEKIENIKSDYSDKLNFVENAKALRAGYNFPAMYWGGAKYFIEINSILMKQEGFDLNSLIKKYQSNNRNKDKNIEMLLRSLDKDLKTPVFRNLYIECNTKPFIEIYNFYQ